MGGTTNVLLALLAFIPTASAAFHGLYRISPSRHHRVALSAAEATTTATGNAAKCVAYFDAWNRRDMEAAVALFSEDVTYEDTVYPEVFSGRDELEFHLLRVADALPRSFVFVVDDISSGSDDARAVGGMESNGPSAFYKGRIVYTFDSDGNINTGFDLSSLDQARIRLARGAVVGEQGAKLLGR